VKWRKDSSPSKKHPHIITDEDDLSHKSITLTHSAKQGTKKTSFLKRNL